MKDLVLNAILVVSIVFLVFAFLYSTFPFSSLDKAEIPVSYNTPEPYTFSLDDDTQNNEVKPVEKIEEYKPYSVFELGHWGDDYYINDELGIMIKVPNGWSVSKGSSFIHLSEFKTGNFVEFNFHKHSTAEYERIYENSQGKPRGINYREDETLGSEVIAGNTYLTLKYKVLHIDLGEDSSGKEIILKRDVNDVAYIERHYYRDIEWKYNDNIYSDDSFEIRCRLYDTSGFNLSRFITKLDK